MSFKVEQFRSSGGTSISSALSAERPLGNEREKVIDGDSGKSLHTATSQ